MKTGLTLQQLASELQRQTETRKDYIAPQGKVDAVVVDGALALTGFNGSVAITPHAHGQLASHLGIPKAYYDRMHGETPELLAANVRTWLHKDPENKRMIRTLDGKVRAFMSPKFRPLDNFDLASAVLPALIEMKAEIVSAELTQTRMYIKAILPALSDTLPAGLAYGGHNRIAVDTDRGHLVAGIVVANSDVGDGTLRVEPSVITTWCTNLAIMQQAAMKKYHVGRAHEADSSWEVFRDETRRADDAAFWLKVQDVARAAFDEKLFRAAIASIRDAAGRPITSDNLPTVVEVAIEQLSLPPAVSGGVLKFLSSGGDLTQWGLSSAITRMANDADDYELATTLERAGGRIIELAPTEWQRIATAA